MPSTRQKRLAAMSVPQASIVINVSNFEAAKEKWLSNGDPVLKESPKKEKVRCALSDRAARVLEIAVLTTVIICAMALLSIPSIIGFATQVSVAYISYIHANTIPTLYAHAG